MEYLRHAFFLFETHEFLTAVSNSNDAPDASSANSKECFAETEIKEDLKHLIEVPFSFEFDGTRILNDNPHSVNFFK